MESNSKFCSLKVNAIYQTSCNRKEGVFLLRIALKTLLWRVWNYPIDFKCCFSHLPSSRESPTTLKIRYGQSPLFNNNCQLIWLLKRVKMYTKIGEAQVKTNQPQKYQKLLGEEKKVELCCGPVHGKQKQRKTSRISIVSTKCYGTHSMCILSTIK